MRIAWGAVGSRTFEYGVSHGVFYPRSGVGVPWNGLVGVDESSSGGEHEPLYYDGVKYMDIIASQDFVASIEAYSEPDGFAACEGNRILAQGLLATHQPRESFGFSYRSMIGNDVRDSIGHKLHLVYNATALPSGRSNKTRADKTEAATRTWAVETVPPLSSTYKPTAHLVIDSRTSTPEGLLALENILYGTESTDPRLPTQAEVIAALNGT